MKYNHGERRTGEDELGRNWTNAVRFNLPDQRRLRASTPSPTRRRDGRPGGEFAHVGTVLFNMVVNPAEPARVYVSNTEARNEVRFEGPGILGGTTVRGHLHEARITVIDGASVLPRHLNKHINYAVVPEPAGRQGRRASPRRSTWRSRSDGTTLYVAAFGSSAVGVFDTGAAARTTRFVPDAADHIARQRRRPERPGARRGRTTGSTC